MLANVFLGPEALIAMILLFYLGNLIYTNRKKQKLQEQRRKEEEKEIQKAETERKNRLKKYEDLAKENGLQKILQTVRDISFKVAYMTNEEAYEYYNKNKETLLNLKNYLSNNTVLINTSIDYEFELEEEIKNKCNEISRFLEVLNYGDDKKEFFDTKVNGYLGVIKGITAELEIRELLTKYFPSMYVIDSVNISFEKDENYHDFENDAILVGRKGIFTIEIKSKTYIVHEHGRDFKKLIVYSDGSTSEKEGRDLIKQSVEHANLLEVFLTKKLPNIDYLDTIHEIMVVTNEEVEIVNQAPSEYNVVKPAGLRAVINKYPVSLTDNDVKQIIEILEQNKVAAKKYPFLIIEAPQINEIVAQQNKLISIYNENNYIQVKNDD